MINSTDLFTLEQYSRIRDQYKKEFLAHKKNRQVQLGENVTLTFEDETTVRYQIQEMLRIEKTFDQEGIQNELDAYNPLIPNGSNLKATMFIEYGNPEVRKRELEKLVGIEHKVYMQVDGHEPIFAIADEDMERSTETKTSAVHFMRFEFDQESIKDLKAGKKFIVGIDHENYESSVEIKEKIKESLTKDFK